MKDKKIDSLIGQEVFVEFDGRNVVAIFHGFVKEQSIYSAGEEVSELDYAKYCIKELGDEGGWRQAADEWGNANTDIERKYYSDVMDIIKLLTRPTDSAGSEVSDEEIEKEALRRNKDDYPDELGYGTDAFENGAKWMRSKLTHQPVSEEEIYKTWRIFSDTLMDNGSEDCGDYMSKEAFFAAIKELNR